MSTKVSNKSSRTNRKTLPEYPKTVPDAVSDAVETDAPPMTELEMLKANLKEIKAEIWEEGISYEAFQKLAAARFNYCYTKRFGDDEVSPQDTANVIYDTQKWLRKFVRKNFRSQNIVIKDEPISSSEVMEHAIREMWPFPSCKPATKKFLLSLRVMDRVRVYFTDKNPEEFFFVGCSGQSGSPYVLSLLSCSSVGEKTGRMLHTSTNMVEPVSRSYENMTPN